MNVDDGARLPLRADEEVVSAILARVIPVLVVSDLHSPTGTVGRTQSLLTGAGREVRVTRPVDFDPAQAAGALVTLFVRPDRAADLARRAAAAGAAAVWLGPGLVSDEARAVVEAAGIVYVEDRDLKLEFEVNVLGFPRRDFVPM